MIGIFEEDDMNSKEHDFHLVEPSPWPIAISAAILLLALGLVGTLHKQISGIFGLVLGISAVSGVLFYWWRDVIKEAIYEKCRTAIVKQGLKFAMYLFIISEVVFFIAFFCSFFKAWLDPVFLFEAFSPTKKIEWPPEGILPPDPWSLPFMNTLILLLSGTTVTSAHHFLLENDKRSMIKMLSITILLFFIIVQAIEYYEASFSLQEAGEKLIYTSNFYMITGFHCMHVIIGIILLSVCLFRARRDQITPQDHLCFEFASWYWHFVDVVWIFLFVFVYWLSLY